MLTALCLILSYLTGGQALHRLPDFHCQCWDFHYTTYGPTPSPSPETTGNFLPMDFIEWKQNRNKNKKNNMP